MATQGTTSTLLRLQAVRYDKPFAATQEELWLQTSEGPHGTPTVLQLLAMPLSVDPADHSAAHPKPHPIVCG